MTINKKFLTTAFLRKTSAVRFFSFLVIYSVLLNISLFFFVNDKPEITGKPFHELSDADFQSILSSTNFQSRNLIKIPKLVSGVFYFNLFDNPLIRSNRYFKTTPKKLLLKITQIKTFLSAQFSTGT